ncbi:MAG: hypothetical protein QGH45_24260 [Myxococcota bacterium]|nr:hypothetical protein [Myxococcota bacterium]
MIDASNPMQLEEVGFYPRDEEVEGLDIADPSGPAEVGRLDLPGSPRDVALDGDRAFVALGSDGLALVSLDDPEAPALIEVEDTPGSALAVDWGGTANGIYVGDWNDIRVFDLTDRDDARLIGREPLNLGSGSDSRTLVYAASEHQLGALENALLAALAEPAP